MDNSFAVKMTLLRKEQNISQKKAAEELGISQALLSHYEKGIRECGLHFVVKAADYYQVSCDYLLGCTNRRSPTGVSFSPQDADSKDTGQEIPALELSRGKLVNAINIVFGILEKINSGPLGETVDAYLSSAVYTVYRCLCAANPKSSTKSYKLDAKTCETLLHLTRSMQLARLRDILNGEGPRTQPPLEKENLPVLNTETITKLYPRAALSLLELIENVERNIPALWQEQLPQQK